MKLLFAAVITLALTAPAWATRCREVCRDGAWGTGYCYVDCR
jgi:hypothetical protein